MQKNPASGTVTSIIVHNLSGLLLSIIIQDLIIHNKDWTIDNNYFNRRFPTAASGLHHRYMETQ